MVILIIVSRVANVCKECGKAIIDRVRIFAEGVVGDPYIFRLIAGHYIIIVRKHLSGVNSVNCAVEVNVAGFSDVGSDIDLLSVAEDGVAGVGNSDLNASLIRPKNCFGVVQGDLIVEGGAVLIVDKCWGIISEADRVGNIDPFSEPLRET